MRSKILDNLIMKETRLKVSALSAERKPLNLDARLINYDDDGLLYKGRLSGDCEEAIYYIPRNAIASIRFRVEDFQPAEECYAVNERYTVSYSGESDMGELLRNFREQAGLTKEKVSRLAGISRSHLYNVEGHRVNPGVVSVDTIRKILSLYDIQPPEAMKEIEKMLKEEKK